MLKNNNKITKPEAVTLSLPQYEVFSARTYLNLDMAGQGGGKTLNIGFISGFMICNFPEVRGFIGANTYLQLSQSTLLRAFDTWKKFFLLTKYDKRTNPSGSYVVDVKPPAHFKQFEILKDYNNTISFVNGGLIYTGSLDNYMTHEGKEFGWAHLDETKNTKEEAVREVILGRIRQRGLWYDTKLPDQPHKNIVYNNNISDIEAEKIGYKSFNPCYIHTSPSFEGVEWLIKMFKIENKQKEIKATLLDKSKYYKYQTEQHTVIMYQSFWNNHNLPKDYLKNRMSVLSETEALLLVYGYPFGRSANDYYHKFNRSKHVVDRIIFNRRSPYHISYDFNVMPYVTLLISQVDYVVKYYNEALEYKSDFYRSPDDGFKPINVIRIKIGKEITKEPPNNLTELATEEFGQWYQAGGNTGDAVVYGDASGRNRITGLGSLTQYKIIQAVLKKYCYSNLQVKKSNIGVLIRKNFINKLFSGFFPNIEIYISAECVQLIYDLENLKSLPDGTKYKEKTVDKTTKKQFEKIGHTSDAFEYYVCELLRAYLKDID